MALRRILLVALLGCAACLPSRQNSTPAPRGPQGGGRYGAPAPQPQPQAPPAAGGNASALEAQALSEVNARRQRGASCGGRRFGPAPPLVLEPALQRAARAHSQDMAARDYFDHTTPEGRTMTDRLLAVGYRGKQMGENIASGHESAQETVEQWMQSPGHCENIMDPTFRQIGIGYAHRAGSSFGHYWTQNFGG